jgi:excinuclease ABC subunit B
MYADRVTESMRYAIDETERRRAIQTAYNEAHGITPAGIEKTIRDIGDRLRAAVAEEPGTYVTAADLPKDELARMIADLERQMKAAAKALDYERAALVRDQIVELRREQAGDAVPEGLRGLTQEARQARMREATRRPDKRKQRGGRSRNGHN